MKRCAFVVRVSDSRQGDEPGKSPDSQKAQLDRYIALYNYNIKDTPGEEPLEFFDEYRLIGVSGDKSFDDKEFRRLRTDVEKGNVHVVMATCLDRFGRSVAKFLEFFEYLQSSKVDLVVTQYHIDTSTPTGKLVITILMALAEMQRHLLSKKITETRRGKLNEGLRTGGSIPLGYDRHPTKKGLLIINEKEAVIVRLIFRLFKEHLSFSTVARLVNEMEHRNKVNISGKGKRTGGQVFKDRSIRYILNNWTYCGWMEHHKINKDADPSKVPKGSEYRRFPPKNPNEHPVIIPKEELVEVERLMHNITRRKDPAVTPTYPYVLSGLVVCQFCKKPMDADKGKDTNYYACTNPDCPGRKLIPRKFPRMKRNAIAATVLEDSVRALIHKVLIDDPKRITEITREANKFIRRDLVEKGQEIGALRSRKEDQESLRDGVFVGLNTSINDKALSRKLNERLKSVTTEIAEIEKSIREYEDREKRQEGRLLTDGAVRIALDVLASSPDAFPPHQQKELYSLFFKQVLVGLDEITVDLFLDALQYYTKNCGPKGPQFDSSAVWYARRDSNPKPSGP